MQDIFSLHKLAALGQVLLDVVILSVAIFYTIRIVRNNARTVQLFKGILFVIIADAIAKILGLKTIQQIAEFFMNWGFLAIIIIFQPEIRSLLEKLGKSNVFSKSSTLSGSEKEHLIRELVSAVGQLAEEKTGALISIEGDISLEDYIKTGTRLNSLVSRELLMSIFVSGTPLHDGAVIIRGDKIASASAYFPPTEQWLPSKYGARHRAGIGISEVSDAITIIVSEETGLISLAQEGKMSLIGIKELEEFLHTSLHNVDREIEIEKEQVDQAEEKVSQLEQELKAEDEESETTRIIQQFSKDNRLDFTNIDEQEGDSDE